MNKVKLEKIMRMYEELNLPLEAIADHIEEAPEAVKGVLLQHSAVFKQNAVNGDEYISKEDLKGLYEDYKNLARFAESDAVKEKALWNLINDGRGRIKGSDNGGGGGGGRDILVILREEMKQAKATLDISSEDAIEVLS